MTQSNTQTRGDRPNTERNRRRATPAGARADGPPITRRRVLAAGGIAGVTALAGCSTGGNSEAAPPDPVSIADGTQCEVCGMVIAEHPGPTGQIFYRDRSPEDHDNPARFDSLKACLFPYYFERQQQDWTVAAVYVTDYSKVDYEVSDVEGETYIQTATAAETFTRGEDAVFVIESEVHGAMGPDFVPFSNDDDAASFSETYGGRTVTMDEITPELLS